MGLMPAQTREARAAPSVLELSQVSFSVAQGAGSLVILDAVDLAVRQGEFLSIVGGSGCGKTTLLRLIAGLNLPTQGAIRFESAPVTGPSRDRAVVFQDYGKALLPWRTVAGNVALALEARGAARSPAIVDGFLDQVGLLAARDRYPAQLSGGMQQRLQIARCLAQAPRLLLMDEPFGALDAMTRQTLQDEIADLARDRGVTVVFITHDLEEAIYLGDRVVALKGGPGRIAADVTIDLPRPRRQLDTREDPRFLDYRHTLFSHLPGAHR